MTLARSATLRAVAKDKQTTANVAKLATEENVLALGKFSLIGVFGPEGSQKAMFLTSQGRTISAKAGQRTSAGRLVAVNSSGVVLDRQGKSVRMKLPR